MEPNYIKGTCKECGAKIVTESRNCPFCNAPLYNKKGTVYLYVIIAIIVLFIGFNFYSYDNEKTNDSRSSYSSYNVDKADAPDIVQATQFLSSLPAACGQSNMDVSEDGTVNIHIICKGSGETPDMDGLVKKKNGFLTKVR